MLMTQTHLKQRKWGKQADSARTHLQGDALCIRCEAVYHDQRWSIDSNLRSRLEATPSTLHVLCTGCVLLQELLIEGTVTLRRTLDWTLERCNEAIRMCRHEEERLHQKDPLHRITSVDIDDTQLEITTTTEFLSRHLARRLERAFGCRAMFHQAPGEKYVRIELF